MSFRRKVTHKVNQLARFELFLPEVLAFSGFSKPVKCCFTCDTKYHRNQLWVVSLFLLFSFQGSVFFCLPLFSAVIDILSYHFLACQALYFVLYLFFRHLVTANDILSYHHLFVKNFFIFFLKTVLAFHFVLPSFSAARTILSQPESPVNNFFTFFYIFFHFMQSNRLYNNISIFITYQTQHIENTKYTFYLFVVIYK